MDLWAAYPDEHEFKRVEMDPGPYLRVFARVRMTTADLETESTKYRAIETITLQGFEYVCPSWDHPRGNRWRGVVDDEYRYDYHCIVYAETPQDAACMLAIPALALVMLNAIIRVSHGLPLV